MFGSVWRKFAQGARKLDFGPLRFSYGSDHVKIGIESSLNRKGQGIDPVVNFAADRHDYRCCLFRAGIGDRDRLNVSRQIRIRRRALRHDADDFPAFSKAGIQLFFLAIAQMAEADDFTGFH